MKFVKTPIEGAYIIELDKISDDRGFFARTHCLQTMQIFGINGLILQESISFNKFKSTLRGLHYQSPPFEEDKFVNVNRGKIYDVIVDVRKYSVSYLKWFALELSSDNYKSIYIPKGVAHGFQSLVDNTVVNYKMTANFSINNSVGIRWNDPSLNIEWPIKNPIISTRDESLPLLSRSD